MQMNLFLVKVLGTTAQFFVYFSRKQRRVFSQSAG